MNRPVSQGHGMLLWRWTVQDNSDQLDELPPTEPPLPREVRILGIIDMVGGVLLLLAGLIDAKARMAGVFFFPQRSDPPFLPELLMPELLIWIIASFAAIGFGNSVR